MNFFKYVTFLQQRIFTARLGLLLLFLLPFIASCEKKIDPVTNEPIIYEPNPNKRARDYADKGGGLFGDINNRNKTGTTFEFASSNVLWRATLNNLNFLPLLNADYSGGIIIYDWYSEKIDKEQIKISVRFLSSELKSSSLLIIGHKKVCDDSGKCFIKVIDNNLTESIKESIISAARVIKIEDSKKDQGK
jgi:hypothetical protein